MPGTWISMASFCSSRRAVAYQVCNSWADEGSYACSQWADQGSYQCSQWADQGSYQCSQWADQGYSTCSQWADQGYSACCDWWPCSWACDALVWISNVVCVATVWVVNLVCQVWYWVANLVCQAFLWVANLVCQIWIWIAHWVCLAVVWVIHLFCISGKGGSAFLLTDGSILMNECASGYGTRRWWKLAPDSSGNYAGGIWLRVADSINARKYFASAVLADGRLAVAGGEYSDVSGSNTQDDTNKCEIYDPVADAWAPMTSPGTLAQVGDAACSMLADGRLLIADLNSTLTFTLNPATLAWSPAGAGGAKNGQSGEESWTQMPDGTVVTVECFNPPNAEKYDPASDSWVSAGALSVNIVETASFEIGPGVLLPDKRAFYVGASGGTTALYTMGANPTAAGSWSAGPAIPATRKRQPQGSKDGPAALEPGGKVLFAVAPVDGTRANYLKPCSFYEFDGATMSLAPVTRPPNWNCETYVGRLLVLPSGDIFWAREDHKHFYLFRSTDVPQDAWRPVVTASPAILNPGATTTVSGQQFNGLSNASAYGDDYTPATNYPIVRIRNRRSGHIRYCRTANHSIGSKLSSQLSMGVATGTATITTQVFIPGDIERGESELFVVANGIPSASVSVVVM